MRIKIATDKDNYQFSVMTDREKLTNGLYRFSNAPTSQKIFRIATDPHSDRKKILGAGFAEYFDYRDSEKLDKYLIAINVAGQPGQWTGESEGIYKALPSRDLPERANVFECMPPECLADLQSGKAVLLIDQTHEGYNAPWLWEWFYTSISKYNVKSTSVIYVTGDLLSSDLHSAWCDEVGIPDRDRIKVFGHSIFEEAVFHASQHEWSHEHTTFEDHITYKTQNLNKIKHYNCLQKRVRGHRVWFLKELWDHDLIDKGINTMNAIPRDMLLSPQGEFCGDMYFLDERIDPETINKLNDFLPLMPEQYGHYQATDIDAFSQTDSGKWVMMLNRDILLDSFVSVISEASAAETQCFCSEKIFKPIAQSHPFMVWGDRHTLAKMREMGYQTFDNWWSESWDELDMRPRLDGLVSVISDLCKRSPEELLNMYSDMESVLRHNYEVLYQKSKSDVRDEVKYIVGALK